MLRATLISIGLLSLLVAGCFDAPTPECAFLCGQDGACPDGYSCRPDGWCKRAGSGSDMVPDNFTCGDTVVPTVDANLNADADTRDATPMIDGPAGQIDAGLALGSSCTTGDQCNSGFCTDSVCCDAACAGDCQACSVAAGATTDGTCALLGSTVECRAAVGQCDVAESCNGAVVNCPVDGFAAATTQCTDTDTTDCDDAQCDGGGTCVQAGGVELASFECRAAVGECDVAENCNGTDGGTCPTDLFESAGVSCTDTTPTNCKDAQCNGGGGCVQDFANEAMSTPCGPGVAEPTCNPDVCDAAGVCTDVAAASDETACTEVSSGDCCTGECTDTSGSGNMCPP